MPRPTGSGGTPRVSPKGVSGVSRRPTIYGRLKRRFSPAERRTRHAPRHRLRNGRYWYLRTGAFRRHSGLRPRVHVRPAPGGAGTHASSRPAAKSCSRRKTSGGRRKRPELERLLAELRADDVVVVTRLDRLARSTSELLRIAETIEEKKRGTSVHCRTLGRYDDGGRAHGAHRVRRHRGVRTRPDRHPNRGRDAAPPRLAAFSFGRPPKLRPDQRTLARNLIEEGKSVSDVARTFNVHVATIYRCLHDEAAL